ncbi:MAG: ABC transporter substrate-binding protein, partial [Alphaproteobacteria bacterium]|nr:ABC transporter substrate-binding protein [Alphaproteobacteria bacterium]
RRALALAIDRRAIMENIYQGLGWPATTMMPTVFRSADTALPPPPLLPPADPEGARQLLEEAGVSGLEIEIWPSPVARPYMPDARLMAEMIHKDWLKIGVNSTIIVSTGRDFIKQTMVGQHDVMLFGWIAENFDRSLFLAPILGCPAAKTGANRSYWCNENFDRLLDEASRAKSSTDREALYGLANAILDEEVPVLPIASSISFTPMRNEVVNYRSSQLGGHYFYGVDLY